MPVNLRHAKGLLLPAVTVAALAIMRPPASQAVPPQRTPATQPALTVDAETARLIANSIRDLGAVDFAIREKATRALLSIGESAQPALIAASTSDDPEISLRAKALLASFEYGVRPDTPQVVIDELRLYQRSEPEQRKVMAGELAQHGVAGARVLLKLAQDEPNPTVRQVVINALGSIARPVVPQLIADDEHKTAERLLASIAPYADYAARDHAAFLYLHGGLDREIAQLEQPSDPSKPLPLQKLRLACLYRAKGNHTKAAEAALAAQDLMLHGSLMADAGKYAELAKLMEARGITDGDIEELGFITAFYRLAGDAAATDRWARKLVEYAHQNTSDHWNAVEALMLNERPEQAIEVLLSKQNHAAAADYLTARLDFKRLEEVVRKARDSGTSDLPKILCRYAQLQHFQGDSEAARETLLAVSRGEEGPVDVNVWAEIVGSAAGAGIDQGTTDRWIAHGLVVARQPEELSRIFERAGFLDSGKAQAWWRVLRDHREGKTPAEALELIRRIDRSQMPADELASILQRTRELAQTLPQLEKLRRLRLVADALAEFGKLTEAIELSEQIVSEAATAENLIRLGELHGRNKAWDAALDAFVKAFKADPASAAPMALQGWALRHLGRDQEADQAIQQAHLMPLANETARHALADVFAQHDMKSEALKERQLTARLGDPSSWEVCDSIRRLADETATTDALTAAAMWDRAFLSNLTTRTMFVEASANLSIPVLIRRTKAIGRIAKSDIAGAVADAQACFQILPSDADAQIVIINELEKTGHKAEADALYKQAFNYFAGIQKQYPQSAPANNLLAWMCGSVKRDLDYALKCAEKAVDLEPNNTAILDTLSEVHFARGELDEALAINQRCREMEPHIPHHQENFQRFKKAKARKVK